MLIVGNRSPAASSTLMIARSVSGSRAISFAVRRVVFDKCHLDPMFRNAVDNVVVGEHIPPPVDHHARAHAIDVAVDVGMDGARLSGCNGNSLLAADIHHRSLDTAIHPHGGSLSPLGAQH